jgi:predicted PurR-regulated permease PerM/methylmalonyl-CoA mutase cobalamin-binding subunit
LHDLLVSKGIAMAKDRSSSPLFILVAMITAVAALYFAKAILLPLALAILLCFLLTPLANRLERWHIPRIVSTILVVALCVAVMGGLGYVVTNQLVELSAKLPEHKQNLLDKVRSIRPSKTIARVSETLSDLRQEIVDGDKAATNENAGQPENQPPPAGSAPNSAPPPSYVQPFEISYDTLLQLMQSWLSALVAPITTAALVMILIFFILLDRENQRSRLVQLFGRTHLHTTTEAIHDVAKRVGRYLRMLFVVNATYGIAITLGMSLIGLPGAIMWGVLAFSLRFLPYLGPWIAAVMPIIVSIAISPGWTQPMLVAGWFIIIELISNNVVEPLLYGSSIGMSTVGVLVAAIFWTWLWGPIGLILAMPMTVCLIVGARYVPQLRFITVLLADQPPLTPAERVYQRLLSYDYQEPLKIAQKHIKDSSLARFYDDVLAPALCMAEEDRYDDLLSEDQAAFVLEAADDLVQELGDEAFAAVSAQADGPIEPLPATNVAPKREHAGTRVLCIPLRDHADEISSHMLAQLLVAEGFDVATEGAKALTSEVVDRVAESKSDIVVISILPPIQPRDSRLLWKRLRARYPNLPIVVGIWTRSQSKDSLAAPSNELTSKVVTTFSEAITLVRALAAQHNPAAKTA